MQTCDGRICARHSGQRFRGFISQRSLRHNLKLFRGKFWTLSDHKRQSQYIVLRLAILSGLLLEVIWFLFFDGYLLFLPGLWGSRILHDLFLWYLKEICLHLLTFRLNLAWRLNRDQWWDLALFAFLIFVSGDDFFMHSVFNRFYLLCQRSASLGLSNDIFLRQTSWRWT